MPHRKSGEWSSGVNEDIEEEEAFGFWKGFDPLWPENDWL